MSKRFGRNQKRKMRQLIKEQQERNKRLIMTNLSLHERLDKATEAAHNFVRTTIRNPAEMPPRQLMDCKIVETRVEIPPFVFQQMVNMKDMGNSQARICGILVAETKEKLSRAIEKELTMKFTQMLRETI